MLKKLVTLLFSSLYGISGARGGFFRVETREIFSDEALLFGGKCQNYDAWIGIGIVEQNGGMMPAHVTEWTTRHPVMTERRKLPEDWLYNELSQLRNEMREQHQRLRSDFSAMIEGLRRDQQDHQEFDDETRRRVDKIQTERDVEERQMVKRSSWIALIVSAGLMAAWEIVRTRLIGGKP